GPGFARSHENPGRSATVVDVGGHDARARLLLSRCSFLLSPAIEQLSHASRKRRSVALERLAPALHASRRLAVLVTNRPAPPDKGKARFLRAEAQISILPIWAWVRL